MTGRAYVWLAGWLLAMGLASTFAPQLAFGAEIESLTIGSSGAYKLGLWTPVRVRISGDLPSEGVTLAIESPDGDGTPCEFSGPVVIDPREEHTASLLLKIGQLEPNVRVILRQGEAILAQRTFTSSELETAPVDVSRSVVLQLGGKLGTSTSAESGTGNGGLQFFSLTAGSELPREWIGYEAIDYLLLTSRDWEPFATLASDAPRMQALWQWVQSGGRLVISLGKNAAKLAAEEPSPWQDFLPGECGSAVGLTKSTAIENYAQSNDHLDEVVGEDFRLDVARLSKVNGTIEVYEGSRTTDLPLVIRRPFGFGQVIFVAFDLDAPPMLKWSGRQRFIERLLGQGTERQTRAVAQNSGSVNTLGYQDLSGQLRTALEQFTQVELVSFALVALLIVIYLLCIGPGDYWLLRKVFRRMEWTWVTFPLMVAGFCLLAYGLIHRLKGDRPCLNQLDLVDVEVASGQVRGTTWASVYSPANQSFRFSVPAIESRGEQPASAMLSWWGMPGSGFGGMSQNRGFTSVFHQSYRVTSDRLQLQEVPIACGSTKGLTCRWLAPGQSLLQAELRDVGGEALMGQVTNDWQGHPLKEAVLLYGSWAYELGTLSPGEPVVLDRHANPRSLDTYLHFRSGQPTGSRRRAFDRQNLTDLAPIVDKMMFYQASGGFAHVQLENEFQNFVDLSHLLRQGGAIFVARAEGNAQPLQCDDLVGDALPGIRQTFFRSVIPVVKDLKRD